MTSDAVESLVTTPSTAVEVDAAATSRRTRRMARAGTPAAQPMSEPGPQQIAQTHLADELIAVSAETVEVVDADALDTESAAELGNPDAAEDATADVDAFALASGAFGFAPIDDITDVVAADPRPTDVAEDISDAAEVLGVPQARRAVTLGATPEPLHVASRRRRVARRAVAAGASFGIMGVAGLIAVSMTLPASAVAASQRAGSGMTTSLVTPSGQPDAKKVDDGEIQAFVASAGVQDETLARSDSFSTASLIDVAAEEGIKYSDSLYTNDPDAAIQWPFKVGVAMSSPYGQRWGRLHAGIDLVPGNGAPIQAIADGTVRTATESGGAYGVTVYIDHVIDGQVVTSHYAHMQHGSLQVQAGQKVKVGDMVGKVGNTGRSYGAHLHFEIIINGSTVDPLPWMQKNAGRYEY